MRKIFLLITIIISSLFFVQSVSAQESVRDRINRRQSQQQKQSLPPLTIRAENMNADQTQDIDNVPWMREIYRSLDLNDDKNASLYYPVAPLGDRMNLFTMIFKLLANNEITAYEYLIDGREIFTPEYALNFKDFLDNWHIMHTEENGKYIVEESDIPSGEVLRYYVKEAWYFDKSNSVVDVKLLALCPVMLQQDDFGYETTPYPLFWLPYEEIRPYASRMPIMTSNLNNASNQTIDDFFRKHSFKGEIYKTTNMKNLSLAQAFPSDTLMKQEQKRIETQLKDFNSRLWVMNDTAQMQVADANTKKNKKDKDEYKAEVRTNEDKKSSKSGSSKSNSSSTPARSMRNRRGR